MVLKTVLGRWRPARARQSRQGRLPRQATVRPGRSSCPQTPVRRQQQAGWPTTGQLLWLKLVEFRQKLIYTGTLGMWRRLRTTMGGICCVCPERTWYALCSPATSKHCYRSGWPGWWTGSACTMTFTWSRPRPASCCSSRRKETPSSTRSCCR